MIDERINELGPLQIALKYRFNDLELLNKSLTHKSYANEVYPTIKNNERFFLYLFYSFLYPIQYN